MDQFEPRETPAYPVEVEPGPVAVLDRGRVDDDAHRQPFSVDQGVDCLLAMLPRARARAPQMAGS